MTLERLMREWYRLRYSALYWRLRYALDDVARRSYRKGMS